MDVQVKTSAGDSDEAFANMLVDRLMNQMLPVIDKLIDEKLKDAQGIDLALDRGKLADLLGINKSKDTIDSFVYRSGFPYYKVGNREKFWKPAVIEFMTLHQLKH